MDASTQFETLFYNSFSKINGNPMRCNKYIESELARGPFNIKSSFFKMQYTCEKMSLKMIFAVKQHNGEERC